jgi:hypothetical protein
MPYLSSPIGPGGAIVDVLIGVPAVRAKLLTRNSFPVPPAVHVRALVDTGASVSGFTPRVFRELDLTPFDELAILTPSTPPDAPHRCPRYPVSLSLVAEGRSCSLPEAYVLATDCWHPGEGIEGLIGRDILDRCFFQYIGPDQRFTLSF